MRRPRPRGRSQAGKHLKRPREWHHGRAQGKVNDRHFQIIEPVLAEAAAETAAAERARKRPSPRELRQARAADRLETGELLLELNRAAPFVPAWV